MRATVRANPRSTAFVALAHRLCDAGKSGEAEEVCREGLERHPGLVTGQVALGRSLFDRGRLREAQEILIEAARANPDHGDAFRWLGEVTIKRGDLTRARALLEYAEDLSPHDRRVAELLTESGGSPTFRLPRPKTDFENTRVGNARALADRMHEELEAAEIGRARPSPGGPHDGLGTDDPTVVDGAATLKALAGAVAPSTSASDEHLRVTRPRPVVGIGLTPPLPGGTAATPPSPAGEAGAADPRASDVTPPVSKALEEAPTTVDLLPPPPMPARRRTLSAMRPTDDPRRRNRNRALAGGAAVVIVAGVVFLARMAQRQRAEEGPAAELKIAIQAGSLSTLLKARDLGREILAASPGDENTAASLAFASALLARDYGLPARDEAEKLLARAEAAQDPPASRVALIEGTRSLLAVAAGDLPAALKAAERAVAARRDFSPSLLALARVKIHLGDLEGAARDLDQLVARAPELSAAVADRAELSLDLGDAAAAVRLLEPQLARSGDHLRSRLLLAEAQRALGQRPASAALEAGCGVEGKQSPTLAAACALSAATDARLAGDRALALRHARAAAARETPDDARLLSSAALQLAGLGEVDLAADLLARARRLASERAVPIVWAETAVRLGRREPIARTPLLAKPAGPERRLVAARAALAADGPAALTAAMAAVPAPLIELDPDLAAMAVLGRPSPGPSASERAALERRAERGDPVAAYVLGRLAERAGEARLAVRRLEKALVGHGDACEAAAVLHTVAQVAERPSAGAAGLRALRARNSQCAAIQPPPAPAPAPAAVSPPAAIDPVGGSMGPLLPPTTTP